MACALLVATLGTKQCQAFSAIPSPLVSNPRAEGSIPLVGIGSAATTATTIRSSIRLYSEPKKKTTNQIIGLDRGLYLLAIVLFLNIWIFSIPPEFRREKICSEEQVIQYPDSGCVTASKWASDVKDYYANGGGISFDFSIDKKSQPKWMGGEQPMP